MGEVNVASIVGGAKVIQKAICKYLLRHLNENPEFLVNLVTGDEMWVFEYDPESKQKNFEWYLFFPTPQESENE